MDRRQKYQHLLKQIYDGTLFRMDTNFDDEDTQHIHEMSTLNTLVAMFCYVKEHHAVLKQPHHKTNLEVWIAYPLFEYVALCLSDDRRKKYCCFQNETISETIIDRVIEFQRKIKRTRDCSVDIKYRLNKVLHFLHDVYVDNDI